MLFRFNIITLVNNKTNLSKYEYHNIDFFFAISTKTPLNHLRSNQFAIG